MEAVEHTYHMTEATGNRKVGKRVVVTTTSRSSCSDACPFKSEVDEEGKIVPKGCYGEQFHMKMHWDKVSSGNRGYTLTALIKKIRALPFKSLIRHDQVGDLPGDGKFTLYRSECFRLAAAFRKHLAWTYTSYPLTGFNLETIREMLRLGFVINKSCFSLDQVDEAMDLGIPATVVMPSKTKERKLMTPKGRVVARCPAELSKKINCGNCGGDKGPLCFREDRDFAVSFYAHGVFKKLVDKALGDE